MWHEFFLLKVEKQEVVAADESKQILPQQFYIDSNKVHVQKVVILTETLTIALSLKSCSVELPVLLVWWNCQEVFIQPREEFLIQRHQLLDLHISGTEELKQTEFWMRHLMLTQQISSSVILQTGLVCIAVFSWRDKQKSVSWFESIITITTVIFISICHSTLCYISVLPLL